MIPVRYRYKDYGKLAPRATAYSRSLGIFFSPVAQILWGFLWAALVGFVLSESAGLGDDVSYGVAFVSLIPFYWLLHRLKKRLVSRIDRLAQREMEDRLKQTNASP